MANTPEEAIYSRLRQAETFHPASASLFTDWNVQAGDVISVKSDGESYKMPVYNMRLKWQGSPRVEVESTGNLERKPLSAQKRKEYADERADFENEKNTKRLSGGGGGGDLSSRVAEIEGILYEAGLNVDPVQGVMLYATERGENYALGASLKVQAGQIQSLVEKTGVDKMTGEVTDVYSYIQQTAEGIRSEVGDRVSGVYSYISQTKESIIMAAKNVVVNGETFTVDNKIAELLSEVTSVKNLVSGKAKINTLWVDGLRFGDRWVGWITISVNGKEYQVMGRGTSR